jgi:hypothetical protein
MESYKKYKWFYTNSGKLIIGGKSASQNDEMLKSLKKEKKDFYVMHTKEPGSPFCAIISEPNKVTKNDIEECAIFTGCFSRAWKLGKNKTDVDVFMLNQVVKSKSMKLGSWSVVGDIKRMNVNLKLVLAYQNKILRAVPEKTVKKSEILAMIAPGKIDKKDAVVGIALEINGEKASKNELLAALPAGGVRIIRK